METLSAILRVVHIVNAVLMAWPYAGLNALPAVADGGVDCRQRCLCVAGLPECHALRMGVRRSEA